MFAWFRRRKQERLEFLAGLTELRQALAALHSWRPLQPTVNVDARIDGAHGIEQALLALGNHDLGPNTVNAVPQGALACLSRELYQGQMEIANALRSLASAVREHAFQERRVEGAAAKRRDSKLSGETPPARTGDQDVPPDQRS